MHLVPVDHLLFLIVFGFFYDAEDGEIPRTVNRDELEVELHVSRVVIRLVEVSIMCDYQFQTYRPPYQPCELAVR